MNIQTYLRIKTAAEGFTFDPSKYLKGKDLEAYNNYDPGIDHLNMNSYTPGEGGGRLAMRIRKGKYSGNVDDPYFADPKSRDARMTMDMLGKDKHRRFAYTDVSINPMLNLRYGEDVNHARGNVLDVLKAKGYGGADIAGFRSGIGAIGADINEKGENVIKPSKGGSGTIYVDDKGNILARSRGVVLGRRSGRVAGGALGGIGGYYGGNYLANKLGLNAEDAGGWKRFGGSLLRAGGALAGAYGGGWAGARLGSGIGEWIDPQKGTKMNVVGINADDAFNSMKGKK